MIAQRCNATITGIEIDRDAATECDFNFRNSPWADRLNSIHLDAKNYFSSEKYDLIISNPPFFPDHFNSSDTKRNQARQQASLSPGDLAQISAGLLSEQGLFALILPYAICAKYIEHCLSLDLFCRRFVKIHGNKNTPPTRGVMEFSKLYMPHKIEKLTIELEKRHDYSLEYLELLRDFLFLE